MMNSKNKGIKITGALLGLSLLAGCGAQTTTESSTQTPKVESKADETVEIQEIGNVDSNLRFKDMVSLEELKQLDGQEITMIGFMATASPLNGEYIYLMNMPYQNCVFCLPNTTQLVNTMPVYAKSGKTITYTDVPVKVTGTLSFGDTTDSVGYSYQYRIINATVEPADVSGLEEDIRIYTTLVDRGFAVDFNTLMEELYKRVNYTLMGYDESEVTPIDLEQMEALKDLFDGLNQSEYFDILETVKALEEAIKEVNETIENKAYEKLTDFNDIGQAIYNAYYEWLIKPEL